MKFLPFAVATTLAAICASPAFAQTPTSPPGPAAGGRDATTPGATIAGRMMAQGDKNADQKLTRDEFVALAGSWFDQLDPNRTGRVSWGEFWQRFDSVAAPPGAGGRDGGSGIAAATNSPGVFTLADGSRGISLTRAEWQQTFAQWFTTWDANHNGSLDSDEIARGLAAALPRTSLSGAGHQSETVTAAGRPPTVRDATLIAEGKDLFLQICAACHGLAGQGLKPMGPPLVNSEWALGPDNRIVRIMLHGLSGPINVNGTTYQPPNVLPEMPPLAALDDRPIAAVLSYIRSAWGHDAPPVSPARVAAIRAETQDRQQSWKEGQLLEVK